MQNFWVVFAGKIQNITLCPLAVDGRERCTQAGKRGTASVRKEIRQDCISPAKFSGRSFSFFGRSRSATVFPCKRRCLHASMAQEAVGLTFWKPVLLKSVHPASFFFFRIWFLIFAFSYSWTSGGELGDCKVLFEGVDDDRDD